MIDPRAIIDSKAKLATNVTVGPWSIIGPDVEIGEGSWVGPHVIIKGPSRIGCGNKIFQFASIGEDPQDKKYQTGDLTRLEIGDYNVIREFVTVNRGTVQGGGVTHLGDGNLLMAYVHIAHDCFVGNQVIFGNYAALAGHVVIDDYAILSAYSAIHQFCHVGCYSFIAPATVIRKNVLPYILVEGYKAKSRGLNIVGLTRHGFERPTLNDLQQAYKIIFSQDLTITQAVEALEKRSLVNPVVVHLIEALRQATRGIVR